MFLLYIMYSYVFTYITHQNKYFTPYYTEYTEKILLMVNSNIGSLKCFCGWKLQSIIPSLWLKES